MFNLEQILQLANLSKLKFTDEESEKMARDMSNIIKLMDTIKTFEKTSEKGKKHVCRYENLRKDEVETSLPIREVVKNSKNVKNSGFIIPKIV